MLNRKFVRCALFGWMAVSAMGHLALAEGAVDIKAPTEIVDGREVPVKTAKFVRGRVNEEGTKIHGAWMPYTHFHRFNNVVTVTDSFGKKTTAIVSERVLPVLDKAAKNGWPLAGSQCNESEGAFYCAAIWAPFGQDAPPANF